ncbi:MAG: FAD-binding protein [Desulfovibrionaceae bacterium]|nr:FAD-binding protein [Desulfovibrionaceae bacterium]
MPHKGPHISIHPDFVVNRILRINLDDFAAWPESVRNFAAEIAEELFLVAYNPFIRAQEVKRSVNERFEKESFSLAHHYANSISEGITLFWSAHEAENAFREELKGHLRTILPADAIVTRPSALVACVTDATDLRMELPLMVVEPETVDQISALIRMANELKFSLVPRGGASGMTGGAVPGRQRCVIVRMTKFAKINPVDRGKMTVTVGAGVITQQVIDSVDRDGFLFTVDPASKSASTIGGNIAENSGGPYAFEYGTTLDNLLAWQMVTPTGEIITVERKDHPRHKILPDETAVFEVKDLSGGVRSVVELHGSEIRLPGLGKDVTNKALGGLPGMQKEGVDGLITEATFIVHEKPTQSRVMVLEFYGRSMQQAAVVISRIVELRDHIRREGDYAHLSALEEFNAKYVQAIEYVPKAHGRREQPVSVVIIQIDGDSPELLDKCIQELKSIVSEYENIEIILARDEREAELFWEDRHRLSAIARRTSGFKMNEDIVIPTQRIPDYAEFLASLNVSCAAAAYRKALLAVGQLPGMPLEEGRMTEEYALAMRLEKGRGSDEENLLTDDAVEARACAFLEECAEANPGLSRQILSIRDKMRAGRVIVASHMHAGDGNCHVNIPVNSNDLEMLRTAEEAVVRIMNEAKKVGGAVSGEHGIGITKISFLDESKMEAIRLFKDRVDPRGVFNPAKLTMRELPVRPFTFSFNRLIEDIRNSGLPDKEKLIGPLQAVQACTRCGKCKQVCPMMAPDCSYHYHPRNKNMVLGAIIEALYYSQITTGHPDMSALSALRELMEHCTGCGRCTSVCPVKIPSAQVAMDLRAFLEHEGAGGHPLKSQMLRWIVENPNKRVLQAAKLASLGQITQNRILGVVPSLFLKRLYNPLLAHKGPVPGYRNLYEMLHPEQCNVFRAVFSSPEEQKKVEPNRGTAVLYFPGCGGGVLSRSIGIAALAVLLKTGVTVIVPDRHLCCGYPLMSSGQDELFQSNLEKNREILRNTVEKAKKLGLHVTHLLTACGSCREGIEKHGNFWNDESEHEPLALMNVMQFALPRLSEGEEPLFEGDAVYHVSCHAEWSGIHRVKGIKTQKSALEKFSGAALHLSAGCCGESGMGAIASPLVYNPLRKRKSESLSRMLADLPAETPVLVGCPSCKIGISRILMTNRLSNPVGHVTEWAASLLFSSTWGKNWYRMFRRRLKSSESSGGIREIHFDS